MPSLARLAAVLAAALAPALSLAQEQGRSAGPRAGYSWLWILVAALVLVALLRTLLGPGRRDRPNPPARRPGA